jgi:hypothetical protein
MTADPWGAKHLFQYYSQLLDFIAKLVGSLAWPIVIYLLARIFKSEFGGLMTALSARVAG